MRLSEHEEGGHLVVAKKYIDITNDLVSGILLSHIASLYLTNKNPCEKVDLDGNIWIKKSRIDWWESCRIRPKQFDVAIKKLEKAGFVEIKTYAFRLHIRLCLAVLNEKFKKCGDENEKS